MRIKYGFEPQSSVTSDKIQSPMTQGATQTPATHATATSTTATQMTHSTALGNSSSKVNTGETDNDHFAKYGGVHFRNNVAPEQINQFVKRLPAGKRESLFEVLNELEQKGLISIVNDHLFADGDHVIGGGDINK